MENVRVFDLFAQEYDEWFEKYPFVYNSELEALRRVIPKKGRGLEIGVGTGRFALPFGVKEGVEPAKAMTEISRNRGITVYETVAEEATFDSETYDFVTMITTICFLKDPLKVFMKVKIILKPHGSFIIGLIDKNSKLGNYYESKKKDNIFYKHANFYSTKRVLDWLEKINFKNIQVYQTIFKLPKEITEIEPVRKGYGKGGFVVIHAQKNK
jgi:SAM-dependent methyltransferase